MRRIMNWIKKTVSFVNVQISNDLTVSNDVTVANDLTVSNNLTVTNDLDVSGDTTLAAVINTSLPTSDPTVAGQLWSDAGTVKVSAG